MVSGTQTKTKRDNHLAQQQMQSTNLGQACVFPASYQQIAIRDYSGVSSSSVTPTGCSITSTATVSTAATTGCSTRTFRAAFFTGASLGLALAVVRCEALATLRALPRLAEFALGELPRFRAFDPFFRLATIDPWFDSCSATH
jgi:hypothetical protein